MAGRQPIPLADKVELLRAARRLGVSEACRQAGISRAHYYRLRDLYEHRGEAGLQRERRTPPQVEADVLRLARERPRWSRESVARKLNAISPTGVRGVWLRHNLTTVDERTAFASTRRPKGYVPLARPNDPDDQASKRKRTTEGPPPGPVTIMDAKGAVLRVVHRVARRR